MNEIYWYETNLFYSTKLLKRNNVMKIFTKKRITFRSNDEAEERFKLINYAVNKKQPINSLKLNNCNEWLPLENSLLNIKKWVENKELVFKIIFNSFKYYVHDIIFFNIPHVL